MLFVVNKNNCEHIKSIFPDNQVVFGITQFSLFRMNELNNGVTCDNPGCNSFCYDSEIKSVCVNCFMLITECKDLYSRDGKFEGGDKCPRCSQKSLVDSKYLKEIIENEYYKQTCDLRPPKHTEISYLDVCDYRWCEECKIEIVEDFCQLCNTELCSLCREIGKKICSNHDYIK